MAFFDDMRVKVRDYARPNLFDVELVTPAGISYPDTEMISFLTTSANLPSISIGEIPIARMGYKVAIPGDIVFGEFSVGLTVDVDFEIRNFFLQWIDLIHNSVENTLAKIDKVYQSSVRIFQLDGNMKRIYGLQFFYCWPNNISDIQYAVDNENQAASFTVAFSYTHYREIDCSVNRQPKGYLV